MKNTPLSTAHLTTDRASRTIIEELYSEALVFADEARTLFDLRGRELEGEIADEVRIAISIEGLKTTTRVMQVLAWLLNQRAFLSGELSEMQLRNFGGLPEDRPSDETQMMLLHPAARALIRDTERLHARARRLDSDGYGRRECPVSVMHGQLTQAFATG